MTTRTVLVLGLSLLAATPAVAQDAIDLSAAAIVRSPGDIASWPATVHIDRLVFSPGAGEAAGLSFEKSGADWPNYVPPGWDGPIQYTVWACVRAPGWTCAGFIQMWRDRHATGAPLPSNWTFWWGPEAGGAAANDFGGYQARAGDQMAFFVSAGNARDVGAVTSRRERSNVVLVTLPLNDAATFDFSAPAPPVDTPPPVVTPQPPPVVVPPSSDTDALLSLLGEIEAKIEAKFVALQQQQADDTARILAALPLQSTPLPLPQPPIVVNGESSWLKVITSIATGAAAILAGIGASK